MVHSNTIKSRLLEVVTSKLFGIISFAFVTAIAAQIAFPFQPVPFTFQTVAVVLAGAFLGERNGFYSQVLYLALGSIGLPVFAQVPGSSIGLAVILGPTGGYLLAFPLAAFLTGYIIERRKTYFTVVAAMFAANILIIALGVLQLQAFYIKNISESIKYGAAIFSLWTVAKVLISVNLYYFVNKSTKK